jgi:HK97 family phage major capsid protein
MAAYAPAFGSVFLDHKKVGGMVIFSRELLNTSRAEAVIDREMRSALVSAQDEHLLNPTFSATAARPASVTYGRTEIDATGATSAADVDGVVGDLLAALAGANFEFCSFITTHTNALALSLMRDTSGARAYPEIGVSGGRLAGLPLIASGSAPADVLTLLDSSELLLGDQEELEIQASTAAFISASDDPGSENVWVPLFTTENVALAATRYLNWSLRRPHCAFASAFAPAAPAWQS